MAGKPSWSTQSREAARLALVAGYAVALLSLNVMHFEGRPAAALTAITLALWVALLIDYASQIRHAPDRRIFLRHSLGYPITLLTLPFVTAHNPWLVAVPLLIGFVLQLRRMAAGHAATFALALFTFVAVLATAGVVYAEQDEPTSKLRDWPSAATWAVARLIHLRGYATGNPKSPDGQGLSFVLAISGLLVAALLTAKIVSWVVGSERESRSHNEPGP